MRIYRNLLAEKVRAGLKDNQIAEILKISRPCYDYKMRKGSFTVEECKKLCDLFGCKFEYLFETNKPNGD